MRWLRDWIIYRELRETPSRESRGALFELSTRSDRNIIALATETAIPEATTQTNCGGGGGGVCVWVSVYRYTATASTQANNKQVMYSKNWLCTGWKTEIKKIKYNIIL